MIVVRRELDERFKGQCLEKADGLCGETLQNSGPHIPSVGLCFLSWQIESK
jgi:hypothetical protein